MSRARSERVKACHASHIVSCAQNLAIRETMVSEPRKNLESFEEIRKSHELANGHSKLLHL